MGEVACSIQRSASVQANGVGDTIEQERRCSHFPRALLPRAKQRAVEQDRCGIGVRGHAGLVRRYNRVWQSGA